jgi:hypothetical protein
MSWFEYWPLALILAALVLFLKYCVVWTPERSIYEQLPSGATVVKQEKDSPWVIFELEGTQFLYNKYSKTLGSFNNAYNKSGS